MPDNMDTFIGELQWASELNGYAALAAAVAAVCRLVLHIRQWAAQPGQ
jgi:hypothetical protein